MMGVRGKKKPITLRKPNKQVKVHPEKEIAIGLGEISSDNSHRLIYSTSKFYNIDEASLYNYLYSFFCKNIYNFTRFNNKYQLVRLYKKNERVFEHGHIFYSLIKYRQQYTKRKVFIKELPLIDPLEFVSNIEQLKSHDHLFPNFFGQNINRTIYDYNNSSYIDVICHYLNSRLVEEGITPHFPLFYGTINTQFKKYSYTFTEDEEYESFLKKNDLIDGSECEHYRIINKEDKDKVQINNFPVCLMATETLDFDFGDYLEKMDKLYLENEDTFDSEKFQSSLKSVFFQVAFTLSHSQKRWNMIHNDLHLGNVMLKETDKEFIYYCIGGKFYKVPTHGMIVKIIDWNRATLTLNGYDFNNNVYSQDRECSDMYYFPTTTNNKKEITKPNPSFDLCLLTFEMLNNHKTFVKTCRRGRFYSYLTDLLKMDNGESIYNLYRKNEKEEERCGFGLYIDIAALCSRGVPCEQFSKSIWNTFRLEKSAIPGGEKIYSLEI